MDEPRHHGREVTRSLDLVRRAQQGDGASFEALYERYADRVRAIARARLGPRLRRRVDSADILQETFLAAIRSFDRFDVDDDGRFIHWLARLAERQVYAAADRHGAAKRDVGRDVPLRAPAASGSLVFDPTASGLLPPLAVDAEERERAVETCLDAMAPEARELILLREYAGASWEAVAEELGKSSPDAARMAHGRALVDLGRRLREALGDDGD